MRHGVAHPEEGVSKSDPGDGCRIMDALAGHRVFRPLVIRSGQIRFQQLQRLQRLTVREFGGQHGNIGFQRVGHCVQTTEGAQGLRHIHYQVSVDNRHIRGQCVVRQRIFLPGGIVGDHRKRRDLRSGAGSGGDRHHPGFDAHFREGVDTLADIHKAQRQLFEVGFRMLVHHPHDFRRIHRRSAAQGYDDVGLEGVSQLCTFAHDGQRRVGFHFKEDFGFDARRFQHGSDLIRVSVVEQEAVGDDQCALMAIGDHFIQRDGQRAAAEIDGFRKFMPQHIFSSLCHGFLVDQMFRPDVFRDRVTAPGAAAQGQGGRETKVIEIANAAVGGRGVNQDACGFHFFAKGHHPRGLVILVGIEAGGVADAAHIDQLHRFLHGVGEIFRPIHGQRRGELFMCKRLAVVDSFNFANQDFCIGRHADPGHFGNFNRRLPDNRRV
ncbi:hypothetical protein SB6422_05267 [Klebsiella huaxiensis]|uniref:Uncharacterized protein n=1 Tax=Klebsiella huaxiensis TaxID=2153354 RepID=A0A564II54_9ENTR|nr:hypothetical protein SB6422_05267 [Klebsiella huaxiensis]